MVMKNSKKEVNCDFVPAQSISKTQLKENSAEKTVCEQIITDVKTGHWKPDTGNKEKRIGPKENRTPNHYHSKHLPICLPSGLLSGVSREKCIS